MNLWEKPFEEIYVVLRIVIALLRIISCHMGNIILEKQYAMPLWEIMSGFGG